MPAGAGVVGHKEGGRVCDLAVVAALDAGRGGVDEDPLGGCGETEVSPADAAVG